jgi:Rab-GTPase-TBC domain
MDSLTLKFAPKLHRHLHRHDISPTMYAHPWFMTCFTQVSCCLYIDTSIEAIDAGLFVKMAIYY